MLKQTLSRGFSLFIFPEEFMPERYLSSHKQKTTRMWGLMDFFLFNYESKRSKRLEYDDLKPFMMDKSRRGKKIDKKFLLENVKTTYNIE